MAEVTGLIAGQVVLVEVVKKVNLNDFGKAIIGEASSALSSDALKDSIKEENE